MSISNGREYNGSEIAVIGMSGRFPGAKNLREYWDNLCSGKESISFSVMKSCWKKASM